MAYKPPGNANFTFDLTAYQPATDFYFHPELLYPFIVPPSVVSHYSSQWQNGKSQRKPFRANYSDSLTRNKAVLQGGHQAKQSDSLPRCVFWGLVPERQVRLNISHGNPKARQKNRETDWRQPPAKELDNSNSWDSSITAQDRDSREQWQQARPADRDQTEVFNRVDEVGPVYGYQVVGYQPPSSTLIDFIFDGKRYRPGTTPAVYFYFKNSSDNYPIQPRDQSRNQAYRSNRAADGIIRLPWGIGRKSEDEEITSGYGGETEPLPPKQEPEQPEVRESYLLMNTVSVVALPDRTAIDLRNLEITLDIDSFSWALSAELWGAASLVLVEPDSAGPKQIEVDINGWKWVFIIERYSANRQFGEERYSIYGASRTQLLAAPYAPLRSKSSNSDINAKQAITEELLNTGFTAEYLNIDDYETPDWIIPGGSFSYQNQTAMQVVAKIASTAGSIIVPARDADTLRIHPRFPSSPWAWDSATMDKIIPASMVISLSASWRPEPEYNAVYVSGTHAGVAVNVKRQGTAGDKPAPDIYEDWLTETQVNTERGRNELAKGGHQGIITLELPLTDTNTAPGLVVPGRLVEVQDTFNGASHGTNGDWRALCLSIRVRAEDGRVSQNIELERHF